LSSSSAVLRRDAEAFLRLRLTGVTGMHNSVPFTCRPALNSPTGDIPGGTLRPRYSPRNERQSRPLSFVSCVVHTVNAPEAQAPGHLHTRYPHRPTSCCPSATSICRANLCRAVACARGDLFVPLHWSRHQGPGRDGIHKTHAQAQAQAPAQAQTWRHTPRLPNDRALLLSVVSLFSPSASASIPRPLTSRKQW
jgi:hypothetical protein